MADVQTVLEVDGPPEVPEIEETIDEPFGRASEEPYHRRGSDWLRLIVGCAGITAIIIVGVGSSTFDAAVVDLVRSLPSGLTPVMKGVRAAAVLWAAAMVASAAVVARRWRLTRDLVLAAALSAVIARFIGMLAADRSLSSISWDVMRHGGPAAFPDLRLTVIVATIAAASPYTGRPIRRVGHVWVGATAIAGVFLLVASPRAVVAGLFIGWAASASVHVAFGSPAGRPTTAQLVVILRWLGVPVRDVELAPRQPPDATVFLARAPGGMLRVEVIGRDEVEAQLMARGLRYARYKDAAPPFLTRLHQVEHEACMTLLAREAGVAAPRIVYAGRALSGSVIIVGEQVEGRTLVELDDSELTDELLDQVWRELHRLHGARITHGNLHGDHIVIGRDGPMLVDFSTASTGSFHDRSPADIAELLATTAAIVGTERAVDACSRSISTGALRAALPLLQPAAMSRTTRETLPGNRRETSAHLDELRAAVAAHLDVDEPAVASLSRVKASSVLMAVGTLVAVGALLQELSDPAQIAEIARHADGQWLALAALASLATTIPFTIAFVGSVTRRIAWVPSFELQVATCYANLALPGVGGVAAQVRFLQREGVDTAAAVAAGGVLSGVGSVVAQLGVCALSLWLAPNSFDLPSIDHDTARFLLACSAAISLAVVIAVIAVPPIRRFAHGPLSDAASAIAGIVRSPWRLGLLLGGNGLATVLYAACLLACLRSFGGALSFWTALAMVALAGLVGSLVPFPGGSAAVGAVGLSGALAAFGVPQEIAVSTALANQIVTSLLPAVPGFLATRHLAKRDML